MGNGAKAQQKRDRKGKDEKKGPTSQLKTVSAKRLFPWNTVLMLVIERRCQNDQVQDMLPGLPEHHQPHCA
jgi:TFIIF-interacting CTD phosphatase-like protein